MMTYDMHVHFAELGRHAATDGFLRRPNVYVRMFLRQLGLTPAILRLPDANDRLRQRFLAAIQSSGIDRHVVLAMDAAHDEQGNALPSAFITDNDAVADLCADHPNLLMGASVHPYRADALSQLERAVARGACLVKWIPSTQRIALQHPHCIPFYEYLAAEGVPLLVHTGNEHASARSRNAWNDPVLLEHPLRHGVTVIAAHCGMRLFLHEPCFFTTFCRMVHHHERLFGDLSACGLPTRIPMLRKLLRDRELLARILYGSDFPATVWPLWFAPRIGLAAARRVASEPNPLRRPVLLMQAMGFPEEIFTRAGSLLRLAHGARVTT